jgi:hypothetical protein
MRRGRVAEISRRRYEPDRFASRDDMVREIMTVFSPPPFAS